MCVARLASTRVQLTPLWAATVPCAPALRTSARPPAAPSRRPAPAPSASSSSSTATATCTLWPWASARPPSWRPWWTARGGTTPRACSRRWWTRSWCGGCAGRRHGPRMGLGQGHAAWHCPTRCRTLPRCPQTAWYYPNEVFVDKELLARSRFVKADSDFGKAAHIQVFSGGGMMGRAGLAHVRARTAVAQWPIPVHTRPPVWVLVAPMHPHAPARTQAPRSSSGAATACSSPWPPRPTPPCCTSC